MATMTKAQLVSELERVRAACDLTERELAAQCATNADLHAQIRDLKDEALHLAIHNAAVKQERDELRELVVVLRAGLQAAVAPLPVPNPLPAPKRVYAPRAPRELPAHFAAAREAAMRMGRSVRVGD